MTYTSVAAADGSQLAARGAIVAAAIAFLALAALHVVRQDLDVSRSMISQYAVGPHGWIMGVCFAAFAVASAALMVTLMGEVRTPLGWLGLAALTAAVIGLGFGATFPMDPVSTTPETMSFSGRMHGVGFMVGVPGELFTVLLLTFALRGQPAWSGLPLGWIAAAVWVSLAIMVWALMAFMKDHGAPTVLGWFNRLFMIFYGVWIMVAALPKAR